MSTFGPKDISATLMPIGDTAMLRKSDQTEQEHASESKKSGGLPIAWILIVVAFIVMGCGVGWDVIAAKASNINTPDLSGLQLPDASGLAKGVKLPEGVDAGSLGDLSLDSKGKTPKSLEGLSDLVEGARGTVDSVTSPGMPSVASEEPASQIDKPAAVFRLGFGFAAGFAGAFALKKLFKITLFAAGMVMLLLVGLEHAQLISIQWGAMADRYDSFESWGRGQVSSLGAFVTGAIPMTATAMAGLAAGWRAG